MPWRNRSRAVYQEGTEGTDKQNPPKTNQHGGLHNHTSSPSLQKRPVPHSMSLVRLVLGSHSKIPSGFWFSPLSVLWGLQPWLSPGLLQRGSPYLPSHDLGQEEKPECHAARPYTHQWNGELVGPSFRSSVTDSHFNIEAVSWEEESGTEKGSGDSGLSFSAASKSEQWLLILYGG